MKKDNYPIDIQIDRLTNSIVNTISGDSFETEILLVTKEDIKSITKKAGWKFNWKAEAKLADRNVYKLTIKGNPNIIQGVLSISDYEDHIWEMHSVIRSGCLTMRVIIRNLPTMLLNITSFIPIRLITTMTIAQSMVFFC